MFLYVFFAVAAVGWVLLLGARASVPLAGTVSLRMQRVLAAAHLALGGAFILLGISVANFHPGEYYSPPYACQSLECAHGFTTNAKGELYCPTYPPIHIKHASVPSWLKRTRRFGATVCTSTIFLCGFCLWIVGFSMRYSKMGFRDPRHQRLGIACLATPSLALVASVASLWLKAVYGFIPR
jgi:hypothetical protein